MLSLQEEPMGRKRAVQPEWLWHNAEHQCPQHAEPQFGERRRRHSIRTLLAAPLRYPPHTLCSSKEVRWLCIVTLGL